MPVRLISSVRGIGVAVRGSTSTSARSALIASLWLTPKRCSPSPTSSPRVRNAAVPAQEGCQGTRLLHVLLHRLEGLGLVGRRDVGERRLHLRLPWGVGGEGVAGRGDPPAVQHHELLGYLAHRGSHLLARALP